MGISGDTAPGQPHNFEAGKQVDLFHHLQVESGRKLGAKHASRKPPRRTTTTSQHWWTPILLMFMFLFASAQPVNRLWGHRGERIGEARHPGRSRRAQAGQNLARQITSIRIRSHNVGGFRNYNKRQTSFQGQFDVALYQETHSDAVDQAAVARQLQPGEAHVTWSHTCKSRNDSRGTLIYSKAPLATKPLFSEHPFTADVAAVWNQARLSAAWVVTSGKWGGFGAVNYYGIAGANNVQSRFRENERHLKALLQYLHHWHQWHYWHYPYH